MNKSIAVFGGNGFLGRKICEVGIRRGYDVTSFSRQGEAPQAVIHQPWVAKVNWEKADIFDPTTYQDKLKEFPTVVHSIGILFENQSYKKAMNSNFNFLSDIQQLANNMMGSNPMQKEGVKSTYEAIQRDSAVMLADAFIKAQSALPRNFVYISADKNPPMVPQDYILTKREAEFELSNKSGLRSIFMRPGIMYDESHEGGLTTRDILVKGLRLGVGLKECTVGKNLASSIKMKALKE
ncbi:hypothetical protein G210_2265 [Candida maltosa Xu316]|uniref:Thioester reductase (TE) domain-containing protein n=1 Tax=Candida maltosa (strain Xu316) TaxID=1245528 RepID=M3J5R3_CANMX|nr:hypothetical protein G210_2265 [Candida maltosa Xu316]